MESEFVIYSHALFLKELGFNEPCFGYYDNGVFIFWYDSKQENELLLNCTAPLKQQAIKFLLNYWDDEQGSDSCIEYFGDESGSINRHLGFGTLTDAIQILIDVIKNIKK